MLGLPKPLGYKDNSVPGTFQSLFPGFCPAGLASFCGVTCPYTYAMTAVSPCFLFLFSLDKKLGPEIQYSFCPGKNGQSCKTWSLFGQKLGLQSSCNPWEQGHILKTRRPSEELAFVQHALVSTGCCGWGGGQTLTGPWRGRSNSAKTAGSREDR